jgi:CRP/FNR family transcriptional regulator, cyclic AMP receptor protein
MSKDAELLTGLRDEDAAALVSLGSCIQLRSGDPLFHLGAEAESLFVIRRGRIALTLPVHVRGGEQDLLVEDATSGQMLGWSALIPPHRFTLKATASVETEVLVFERHRLLDHFATHPEVGCVVMHNVATVVGRRLQVFQAMWLREIQRAVGLSYA